MDFKLLLDLILLYLPFSFVTIAYFEVIMFGKIKNNIDFIAISVLLGILLQYTSTIYSDFGVNHVVFIFLSGVFISATWYGKMSIKKFSVMIFATSMNMFVQFILFISTISLTKITPVELRSNYMYSVYGTLATCVVSILLLYKIYTIRKERQDDKKN